MIIVPCSMKTLAGVSSDFSENLLLCAADVTLKERRTLVLVPRKSPLNLIHLSNMVLASDAGAIIVPPVISYYNHPEGAHGITMYIVGKILDILVFRCRSFAGGRARRALWSRHSSTLSGPRSGPSKKNQH